METLLVGAVRTADWRASPTLVIETVTPSKTPLMEEKGSPEATRASNPDCVLAGILGSSMSTDRRAACVDPATRNRLAMTAIRENFRYLFVFMPANLRASTLRKCEAESEGYPRVIYRRGYQIRTCDLDWRAEVPAAPCRLKAAFQLEPERRLQPQRPEQPPGLDAPGSFVALDGAGFVAHSVRVCAAQ